MTMLCYVGCAIVGKGKRFKVSGCDREPHMARDAGGP